jgi:hypothetical protein
VSEGRLARDFTIFVPAPHLRSVAVSPWPEKRDTESGSLTFPIPPRSRDMKARSNTAVLKPFDPLIRVAPTQRGRLVALVQRLSEIRSPLRIPRVCPVSIFPAPGGLSMGSDSPSDGASWQGHRPGSAWPADGALVSAHRHIDGGPRPSANPPPPGRPIRVGCDSFAVPSQLPSEPICPRPVPATA